MDHLVEAMVSNSKALAEALAADRARREAADRIQLESWEATLKEKDAEIDRMRAEGAEAKKKLQADESRKMRWKEAYELLLGANQKLAELRDADMEDSKTCAETPKKEAESCTNLSQNTVDQTARNFGKLKQAYETLSSKKDKEVSALLSENDSLRSQLNIMQQDYAELLKNKKVLTHKKDHEIVILRAEAVGAKKKVQKMHALVKEKDDEIQRLIGRHPESVQKYNKDISETRKRCRSGNPAATVKDKLENSGIRQTVEEDYISETRTAEKDGQVECTHKRRRSSPMSNEDEKSGSNENDDEQIGNEEDGDKPTGNDDDSMDAEENASVENLDDNEKGEESEQDGFEGYRGVVDMGCGMEDGNGGEGTTNFFPGMQFKQSEALGRAVGRPTDSEAKRTKSMVDILGVDLTVHDNGKTKKKKKSSGKRKN